MAMPGKQQDEMQDCINKCWTCRAECQNIFFNHCLVEGGKHVEEQHAKLMADCIEICQTAADFMTRQSPQHISVCGTCADVCEACADSCMKVGGEKMEHCAEICRRCAESCRAMSQMKISSPTKNEGETRINL
jgi:hypothetical protein